MHTDDTDRKINIKNLEKMEMTPERRVDWWRWFLKERYKVDLDEICRETCRRVNGRIK